MTVLLLANEEQREELLTYPVSEEIELKLINDPGELKPGQSIYACIDLLFENTKERIGWLKNLGTPLIIINSVIVTLQEMQEPFIRINGWNSFLKRPVIEAASVDAPLQKKTEILFAGFGRTTEWVPDITGLITPRVVATIINEAFFTLEENVSSENEIDTAMKLGTNYPYGPFEWGLKTGLKNIFALLTTLSRQQSRYTPSLLLKQTALA